MTSQLVLITSEKMGIEERDALKYLLSDAISEFIHKRIDPHKYVNDRYGPCGSYYWNSYSSTVDGRLACYDKKVEQVQRRLDLAFKIREACFNIPVQVVDDPCKWLESNTNAT